MNLGKLKLSKPLSNPTSYIALWTIGSVVVLTFGTLYRLGVIEPEFLSYFVQKFIFTFVVVSFLSLAVSVILITGWIISDIRANRSSTEKNKIASLGFVGFVLANIAMFIPMLYGPLLAVGIFALFKSKRLANNNEPRIKTYKLLCTAVVLIASLALIRIAILARV